MKYNQPTLNDDSLPISDAINEIVIKYCAALREIERLKAELAKAEGSK